MTDEISVSPLLFILKGVADAFEPGPDIDVELALGHGVCRRKLWVGGWQAGFRAVDM